MLVCKLWWENIQGTEKKKNQCLEKIQKTKSLVAAEVGLDADSQS